MMADAENEPPTFLPPGSTMHKGLFLGLSTADIVYYLPHHPLNNQKLKAERQMSFAGGPATNAAVAFAAFGNQATLVSGLGRHPLAHVPKMDLADQQVHLIDCPDQPRRPPILASILVDLSTGERSVVYSNTDLRKLRSDAVNESLLEDTDILMLDGYFLPQAVQLAGWARSLELGLLVFCGVGSALLVAWTGALTGFFTLLAAATGLWLGSAWLLPTHGVFASPLTPLMVLAANFSLLTFLKYRREERALRQRNRDLLAMQNFTIHCLAALAETRDSETGHHIVRCQHYVQALAEGLARRPHFAPLLDEETIDLLCKSAPLHDIGKIGVPDRVLLKPGRLS
ncbi:MAG: hypothetical protein EOM10_12950, partial [Opitutae bacterium]|nr:hypothetical protein [Opitutae bacterium]